MPENISSLTDRWVSATGADGPDTRVRARYAREAGLLLTEPRGRNHRPSIEAVHTSIFLAGVLVAGPQIGVVNSIKKLWSLPPRRGTKIANPLAPDWMLFGQTVIEFIEMATTPQGRQTLGERLKFLNVTQGGGYGAIVYSNGTNREYYGEELPYTNYRAKFATITSASPEVFFELAQVITRSRREAAEMQRPINWQPAYHALGFVPPETMYPQKPLIPASNATTKNAGRPARRAGVVHA